MNDTQKTRIAIVLQKHKQAVFQCKEVANLKRAIPTDVFPRLRLDFMTDKRRQEQKNGKESSTHTWNLVLLVSICTLVCAILWHSIPSIHSCCTILHQTPAM